ncbi:hypothetical protein FKM82_023667 [Ascaphus truei]
MLCSLYLTGVLLHRWSLHPSVITSALAQCQYSVSLMLLQSLPVSATHVGQAHAGCRGLQLQPLYLLCVRLGDPFISLCTWDPPE